MPSPGSDDRTGGRHIRRPPVRVAGRTARTPIGSVDHDHQRSALAVLEQPLAVLDGQPDAAVRGRVAQLAQRAAVERVLVLGTVDH